MIKPELLAPAGDFERLKIALLYGADAVYVGGTFNLRANADNFTITEIEKGVKYAHELGKKVYVTVNIALHNKELSEIMEYLKSLDKIGVDAIIVSDPAIINLARENTSLVIHLSTQASTINKEAVEFWKNEGVSRIVLARECDMSDIKTIKDNVDVELETFVHGAMCASYSGRCVLSNYLTARDSNRGGCSQICRWDFDLYEEDEHLKGEKPFTFCTKDLSLIRHIPELMELEVDSLKIEGRMRSSYYIATIIKVYRMVIDKYWNNPQGYEYNLEYEQVLRRCANRDSVPQFFNGYFGKDAQYYNGRVETTNQDFLGTVLEYDENTRLMKLEQRNYFKKGDNVTVFGPLDEFDFVISEIYDENMLEIDIVRHPKQIVYIKVPKLVKKDYMMKKNLTNNYNSSNMLES
ncbi:MAG: U32 family peptidase [Bacilli bacterium]|nr:U32 family peptidase [Bacilli bacterium]